MSRYVKNLGKDKDVAYGHDHATGYFFQLFDGLDEDGNDVLTVDECSMFTNMSNAKMLELMTEHEVEQEHIDRVTMDLTF
jgi:hypothetical protein